MGVRDIYRDQIVGLIDEVLATQEAALDAARDAIAAALKGDRLVYVTGSGHSHILAEEAFYRAGGLAAVQALLDPELMLHLGATGSTSKERESGRAEALLASHDVAPHDVVIIASNSGRNAYPIEMALAAKARGATTIALTSLQHARNTSSRHASGKLLFEVADIVIDNSGRYGDAGLSVGGGELLMGPTSTVVGAFIVNTIVAEAADRALREGTAVDIWQSANKQGAEADAEAMIRRWQRRIRGL